MTNKFRINVERTVAACERVGSCGLRVAGGGRAGGERCGLVSNYYELESILFEAVATAGGRELRAASARPAHGCSLKMIRMLSSRPGPHPGLPPVPHPGHPPGPSPGPPGGLPREPHPGHPPEPFHGPHPGHPPRPTAQHPPARRTRFPRPNP